MNNDDIVRDILSDLQQNIEKIGISVGFKDLTPIHGEWMREMVFGKEDYTLQAHRAGYKSSCLAVSIALMMVIYPTQNIIFLRKTDNDVSEMMGMVTKILRSSVLVDLCNILHSRNEPLKITEEAQDHISTNIWYSPMGAPQLLGIGIRSSITGKHADIVITDDICNISDRISKAERERTKLQYQELQNIKKRSGRIINLGTPWHKDDVFSLMPNIHRYTCYETGLISQEKLEKLKSSMSPSLFAANYELRHIASENALFETAPTFTDDIGMLRDGICHIDAAYGGSDYTAFTCGCRCGDTIYLYGRLWRSHVDTVLDAALADADRLMCAPIYCENNGDKGYLAREIRNRGSEAHIYTERENKYLKISTFLRKWWNNIVFVDGTDTEYIQQITDYTETAEHDDAPDSASCVVRILDRRGD